MIVCDRLGWSFVIHWVDRLWSLGWLFVICWVGRLWSFVIHRLIVFNRFGWSFVIGWVDYLWSFWLFIIIFDCLWSFVIFCDCLWSFVIVCDHLWSFVLICDRLWSFVIVCDHLWLVVIVNWLQFLDRLKWQIFILLTFSLSIWILNIVLHFVVVVDEFVLNISNHWYLASFFVSIMSFYLAFGHLFDWSYHLVFVQGWWHFILVIYFWSYHLVFIQGWFHFHFGHFW